MDYEGCFETNEIYVDVLFYEIQFDFSRAFNVVIDRNKTDFNYHDDSHHTMTDKQFLIYKDNLSNQSRFFSYYNHLN